MRKTVYEWLDANRKKPRRKTKKGSTFPAAKTKVSASKKAGSKKKARPK